MATARHPTIDPDDADQEDADSDDANLDDARETTPERPGVGIAHTTVVPTNFGRDD
ncbi:hypothetical protein [Halorubellus litoreus]|uniref:Uncharacterized protein n=1 Tax=Halorubellus litoreus TaxID=755308 RepID=A0ABD5V8U2_9EURY